MQINEKISISDTYITHRFSRSSGPGGQNVNKVSTKVEAILDFQNCPEFSDYQKSRIAKKLSNRIDSQGCLVAACQEYRTQHANRVGAEQKLAQLINDALKRPKPRKKTAIPYSQKEKRIKTKKLRSDIKSLRRQKPDQ